MPDGSAATLSHASFAHRFPEPVSIEVLARQCRAVSIAQDVLLEDKPDDDPGVDLAYDVMRALDDVVSNLPARTLADAAAQLGRALMIIERLPVPDDDHRAADDHKALTRILASTLRVVAASSGAEPTDLMEPCCLTRWQEHFGDLEQALAGGVA